MSDVVLMVVACDWPAAAARRSARVTCRYRSLIRVDASRISPETATRFAPLRSRRVAKVSLGGSTWATADTLIQQWLPVGLRWSP